MSKYHKIQTIFKRDPETKHKTLLMGDFSIPEFEYLKDNEWVFTEKVDGTNIRIMYNGSSITFGGRTDNAHIPAQLMCHLNEKYLPLLVSMIDMFGDCNVVIYGEGYGAKIQKVGGNYSQEQKFVMFDIKVGDTWLTRQSVAEIGIKLNIPIVAIVGIGTIQDMIDRVKDGMMSTWGDFQAEGIVARPATELKTRDGKRIICKLKCKDFQAVK